MYIIRKTGEVLLFTGVTLLSKSLFNRADTAPEKVGIVLIGVGYGLLAVCSAKSLWDDYTMLR